MIQKVFGKNIGTIGRNMKMNDRYLLEHGYKQYNPTPFDNPSVVARFQKRFDDRNGKKYFIDVLKWSWEFVSEDRRDKWWKPFSYIYEIQVTMFKDRKTLNLEFFSDWTLEEVEDFMENMFTKMNLNYYEKWDEDCGEDEI